MWLEGKAETQANISQLGNRRILDRWELEHSDAEHTQGAWRAESQPIIIMRSTSACQREHHGTPSPHLSAALEVISASSLILFIAYASTAITSPLASSFGDDSCYFHLESWISACTACILKQQHMVATI